MRPRRRYTVTMAATAWEWLTIAILLGILIALLLAIQLPARAAEIRAADITSAESTTWRPGDLVVIYGYCRTPEEVELYVTTKVMAHGCAAKPGIVMTPAGPIQRYEPFAAVLAQWAGAVDRMAVGDSVSIWRVVVGTAAGPVQGYTYAGHGGGPHQALLTF